MKQPDPFLNCTRLYLFSNVCFILLKKSPSPHPINTIIPAVFEINGRLVKLDTVVLYTTNFDEGPFKEPGMGMKFVKISRADRNRIAIFILEQLEEGIVRQQA
jgi:hypothetical protein